MKPRCLFLALALMSAAHTLGAQTPLKLSLGGGASVPLGRFADQSSLGWHALASVGLSTFMQPISLRLDAHYNRFNAKAAGPDRDIASATLNLAYRLPITDSPFSPYVIAGGGAYRFDCAGGANCNSATTAGWNAGLGTKFNAFRLKGFVEARWHALNLETGNVRFVPVTFALTF
jgi:hypothetical protein